MLYVCCAPAQTLVTPVMVPGVADVAILATVSVLAALVPKQLLDFTETLPVV